MTTLRVERLTKRYGEAAAVDDVSFDVQPGEFLSLLGPSGCGKTTILRCIAGFERPDSGRILIDDEPITDIAAGIFTPPNRRGFGMVFQSYAVWPHMTVLDNVSYPLTVQGRGGSAPRPGRAEIRERALAKLEMVGLQGLDARYPNQLSGGQQQRVALARALVMEPRLLLFDEPLSNLDAKLRERMRFELMELQETLGIPAVYVTHDQAEAMVISRRILVMQSGHIAQMGSPRDIYARPRTRFVADFIGLTNFLRAEVLSPGGDGRWQVRSVLGEHLAESAREHTVGEQVTLAIRPERVMLDEPPAGDVHVFETRLRHAYFLGPYSEYFLDIGDVTLRAAHGEASSMMAGAPVRAWLAIDNCLVVEEGTAGV